MNVENYKIHIKSSEKYIKEKIYKRNVKYNNDI